VTAFRDMVAIVAVAIVALAVIWLIHQLTAPVPPPRSDKAAPRPDQRGGENVTPLSKCL
jgi:hypothetical protein